MSLHARLAAGATLRFAVSRRILYWCSTRDMCSGRRWMPRAGSPACDLMLCSNALHHTRCCHLLKQGTALPSSRLTCCCIAMLLRRCASHIRERRCLSRSRSFGIGGARSRATPMISVRCSRVICGRSSRRADAIHESIEGRSLCLARLGIVRCDVSILAQSRHSRDRRALRG